MFNRPTFWGHFNMTDGVMFMFRPAAKVIIRNV